MLLCSRQLARANRPQPCGNDHPARGTGRPEKRFPSATVDSAPMIFGDPSARNASNFLYRKTPFGPGDEETPGKLTTGKQNTKIWGELASILLTALQPPTPLPRYFPVSTPHRLPPPTASNVIRETLPVIRRFTSLLSFSLPKSGSIGLKMARIGPSKTAAWR